MSKPAATRYRTLNRSAYNAELRARGSLAVWFDPAMVWKAEPSGKRGRSASALLRKAAEGRTLPFGR